MLVILHLLCFFHILLLAKALSCHAAFFASLPFVSLFCYELLKQLFLVATQDTGPQQTLPDGPWKAADTSGMLPPSVFTCPSTALLQIPLKCSPYSFSLSNFSSSCPIEEMGFREFSFTVLPSSPWEGLLAALLFYHLSCFSKNLILHQAFCTCPALCTAGAWHK